MGEWLAALYLADKGLRVLDRNVFVKGGEIDLLALDGAERVAVEVRTRVGTADPIDAIDAAKRRRVARLARASGASRVDLIGIGLGREGFDVHWVPDGG